MPALYVIQQNARLRIDNRRLQVELEGEVLASQPLSHVSQVILFGNVGLTTPAIDALLAQNTEVVFLTQRGDYRGRLVGEITPHVPLRRAQYQRLGEPVFILEMAKGFVGAKLQHQRALLLRHNRERGDPEIAAAARQAQEALDSLPHKTALSALLGLEGSSTAAYFRGLRRLFGAQWHFEDRNRRPPRDPVNVLLSLGYTLLAQAAGSAVQAVGLDPYAGFLHEVVYNRPALALDILEEFRPVIDGIVLWCCNGGQLTPQDFTPGPPERPVVLSEAGKKRFLAAYEQRLDVRFTHPLRGEQLPLRQCLVEQARQVAARLQEGPPGYTGMGFRSRRFVERAFYVLVYDISSDKRRQKIAKLCEATAERVQYSVFEGWYTPPELEKLLKKVRRVFDDKQDSLRIYQLCGICRGKVATHGLGKVTPAPGVVIV